MIELTFIHKPTGTEVMVDLTDCAHVLNVYYHNGEPFPFEDYPGDFRCNSILSLFDEAIDPESAYIHVLSRPDEFIQEGD